MKLLTTAVVITSLVLGCTSTDSKKTEEVPGQNQSLENVQVGQIAENDKKSEEHKTSEQKMNVDQSSRSGLVPKSTEDLDTSRQTQQNDAEVVSQLPDKTIAQRKSEIMGPQRPQVNEDKPMQIIMYPIVSRLNVRSGPGLQYGVVRIAEFSEPLVMNGVNSGSWFQMGDKNWVSSLFLSLDRPQRPVEWLNAKKKKPEQKLRLEEEDAKELEKSVTIKPAEVIDLKEDPSDVLPQGADSESEEAAPKQDDSAPSIDEIETVSTEVNI